MLLVFGSTHTGSAYFDPKDNEANRPSDTFLRLSSSQTQYSGLLFRGQDMLARILDLIFVSRSQPAPSCGLDDCSLACFTEPTGKRRDFCSLAHAHLYKAKHGRYPGRPAQSAIQISGNDSISTRDGPFDPTRDYVFPNIVLFWQPPSPFSQWTRSVFQVEEVRRDMYR